MKDPERTYFTKIENMTLKMKGRQGWNTLHGVYREGIVCVRRERRQDEGWSQSARLCGSSVGEGDAAAVAALLWLSTKICLSLSTFPQISVLSHRTKHSIRPLSQQSLESLSRTLYLIWLGSREMFHWIKLVCISQGRFHTFKIPVSAFMYALVS